MQNDDENQGAGFGTPIDPADFSRRRVAGILRREKPRFEQGDRTQHRFAKEFLALHTRSRDAFGIVEVGKLKVVTYNLFGKTKTYQFISLTEFPLAKWFVRRSVNSNIRSRFFTPPCGK